MAVNTKKVQGRRRLSFASIDEVVADAELCVRSANTRMLGNWPLPRILAHLTKAINNSIDGEPHKAPLIARLVGPLLKRRILKKGMTPGFNLPRHIEMSFYPDVPSKELALEEFCRAAGRMKTEKLVVKHPVFGAMTPEEWLILHLRHAELHLSYAVPG